MAEPSAETPRSIEIVREWLGKTDWSPERFAPLIEELRRWDWGDRLADHQNAELVLLALWAERDGVTDDIRRRCGELAELAKEVPFDDTLGACGIVDTGSHLKLPLYRTFEPRPDSPFTIWLHRYYNPDSASGRATTVHSHRYSFTSLVLSGGFTNRLYRFEGRDGGDGRLEGGVEFDEDRVVRAGDVYTMHPDAIHLVTDLRPDTKTLILQSEPQFHWSTAFDLETGAVRHIPDLEAAFERFQRSLSE